MTWTFLNLDVNKTINKPVGNWEITGEDYQQQTKVERPVDNF